MNSKKNDTDNTFRLYLENIRAKEGRIILSDSDLIALAADEISRTYTYEEKQYSA